MEIFKYDIIKNYTMNIFDIFMLPFKHYKIPIATPSVRIISDIENLEKLFPVIEKYGAELRKLKNPKTLKSMRKNLENMHPSTPLAMNLKNRNYVKLIFGDEFNIATKFAEVDVETVRQRIAEKKVEKSSSSQKTKKVIRKRDFLCNLSDAFKIQANYAKVA